MMLAGMRLPAGLGYAEVLPTWDVETYSEAGFTWYEDRQRWGAPLGTASGTRPGLGVVGAAVYSEHPTADLLSLSYDLKDGRGIRRWLPCQPLPADFCEHVRAGGLLEAHNSSFERWINRNVMVPKYGFPLIADAQMRCSMIKSRAHSLPGKLGKIGEVLKLPVQKDKDGQRLLEKFSVPRNPTQKDARRRRLLADEPDEAERLYAYNDMDVAAESMVSMHVPDLPPLELEYWQMDQEINARGVAVDVAGIQACIEIIEQCHVRYNAEMLALTGGAVPGATKLDQLKAWMTTRGVCVDSLDEAHLTELLTRTDLPADVMRALQIRAAVGSLSVKKVYAMRNQTSRAGRLHDLYMAHAAHTGRPTGAGPQPTNLPNSGPAVHKCGAGHWFGTYLQRCPVCNTMRAPKVFEWNPGAVEDALAIIKCGSLELLEMYFGPDPMYTLSGCLRGLFTAAPGHEMICSDYTAIEAVVAACVAKEPWRIEVFRTHGKIYESSAAQMFNVPLDTILQHKIDTGDHHPLRKTGKVAELAFGYGGWINSAKAFGMPGDDVELKQNCLAWRKASPNIEFMWGGQWDVPFSARRKQWLYGLEGTWVKACTLPDEPHDVLRKDGERSGLAFLYKQQQDVLYLLWHGERLITYHAPRMTPSKDAWRGLSLSYEGWNSNALKGPIGWIRMGTWGSRVFENSVQAIANRIFRAGQVALCRNGYPVVMHTYDENCSEVPIGFGSIEEYERLMCESRPWWAQEWPIRAAGGWRGPRYRK